MRIGVLTAGGDCPGLNAGIDAAVEYICAARATPVLIDRGFAGLVDATTLDLDHTVLRAAAARGGTVLRTSRTKIASDESVRAAAAGAQRLGLDGLVVFGGDGSLQGAGHIARTGLPVVGIPKTIDDDIAGTDAAIGFDTAVNTSVGLVDRVYDTARSHGTRFVVETMGRRSGFLAAASADALGVRAAVPEARWDVLAAQATLDRDGVLIVAESAWAVDLPPRSTAPNGKPVVGGAAAALVDALVRSGCPDLRSVVLGHTVRGGPPTRVDRSLARAFAVRACAQVCSGSSGLVVLRHGVVEVEPPADGPLRKFLTPTDRVWATAVLHATA